MPLHHHNGQHQYLLSAVKEEAEVSGIPSIVDDPAAWVEFVSEESNIPKLVAAAEAL